MPREDIPFDPDPYQPRTSGKEELLVTLFHAYNEPATARRISAYLETLYDVALDELEAALQAWRRQPHSRAPSPGEVLALVETQRAEARRRREADVQAEQQATAPEPWTPDHYDRHWVELLAQHPDNRFLREYVAERARERLAGEAVLDGVDALLQAFIRRVKTLPDRTEEPHAD